MNVSNTRPLLPLVSDSHMNTLSSTQGLRRNASGVLAGQQMLQPNPNEALPQKNVIQDRVFNNRLRENWLQQKHNEEALQRSAPQALLKEHSRRIYGEPPDAQIEYKGEFSRYNDVFRDKIMDSLDNLKESYGRYGGHEANFVGQVRDLENYLHFNRPPPLNPISEHQPYWSQGPQTIYAQAGALPPPVYGGSPYPYMYPYYDHDRKLARTHMIAQKQTINELNEELNSVRREGQKFEDLAHQTHSELHKLHVQNFPGIGYGGQIQAPVKWGDAETDKSLFNISVKEQELIRVLSKLPEGSGLYRSKKQKLDELVRQRSELEKMMQQRADQKYYVHERLIDDQKKDNLAQWLRRDLEIFKIDKTLDDEQHYKQGMGFLLYWDYILNLVKEFKNIQIVYGIYNRGLTLFEPRLVPLTETIDTTHPSFAQVIFNINHLVRDIEPHPDVLLILEVQVPAYRQTQKTRGSNIDGDPRLHTGYLLSRYGKLDTQNEQDEDYDHDVPDPNVYQTFGWTCLDLFNFKNDLKRGTYKLPLYKPPTIINIDPRDIPQLERVKDTMLWMRVAHPRDDELNEVRCEPAYYHIYYVPEIHNIAPKVRMNVKPQRDKNYFSDGFSMFIHWVKGYQHDRHVRVAVALQIAKDIVIQDNGHLCFYATKGVNTFNKSIKSSIGQGILKSMGASFRPQSSANPFSLSSKNFDVVNTMDQEKTVVFNELRTWYKDVYNLLWDLELKENAYLIFQYIERKESIVNPTINAIITRKMIEDEYDLVGYTIFQLNNPDGTTRFGTYVLDLYEGPIFVEELDAMKRMDKQLKVTIGRPGDHINPSDLPPHQQTANQPKTPASQEKPLSALSKALKTKKTTPTSQD